MVNTLIKVMPGAFLEIVVVVTMGGAMSKVKNPAVYVTRSGLT